MIEKLGDIASYVNGFAFKPSEWAEEGLPIIRIQDLTGTSSNPNYYNKPYDKKYEINKGDVLISWSASLGVYIWCGEKALLNQHIFKVIFDKKDINKDFFVYQVSHILKKASEQAHGATMRHLTRPVFNSLPFWLPERNIQNKIADTLNLLSKLIVAKEKQVKELDKLIKSRFIELFGDPIAQERDGSFTKVGEVCSLKAGSFVKADDIHSEFNEGLYPCFGGNGCRGYVSDYTHDGDYSIIGRQGALCGNVKYVEGKFHATEHAIVVTPLIPIDNYWLFYLLTLLRLNRYATGAAQPGLTVNNLESIHICVPKLIEQEQFSRLAHQCDKSKLSTENSRKMIQNVIKYREK